MALRARFLCVFAIVALFLILGAVDAKKKKKSKDASAKDRRPSGITPELYCNSCQAMVRELLKILRHRKSESDVMAAMEKICDQRYYYTYEYPPPQMIKGCEAFIADWEEELEKALINREDNDSVETKFCYTQTAACVGADMKKVPQMDDHITIDGKKVPIGKDGQPIVEKDDL